MQAQVSVDKLQHVLTIWNVRLEQAEILPSLKIEAVLVNFRVELHQTSNGDVGDRRNTRACIALLDLV